MSTYADTSFLVSLYVFDDNSARATVALERVSFPFFLTPLLETEMVSAFQLRIFRRESTQKLVGGSWELFKKDVRAGVYEPRMLTPEVFRQARQIATRSTAKLGARTLDLLHVASAVALRAESFCTFDGRQAKLAGFEGLLVQAP